MELQCVEIQGVLCKIPQPGWIKDFRTGEWFQIGIHKRSTAKQYCYWEVDDRWSRYKAWQAEEEERKRRDPKFVHAELSKFILDCWLYRMGGYWYSNNGAPTYLTGAHWFYLSCFKLDIGLPKYKLIDREYFYLWDWAVSTDWCYGLVELTKRRNGKSYRAGCISLEAASRSSNFNVGIQSKTDDDARAFFKKTITEPYRKLPYFFKPKTNLPASGKMSTNYLRFETGNATTDEDELNSQIDFEASTIDAYDGQKLHIYISDEAGKTKTCNINDRWDVVRYCLRDDMGKVVGKAINTTTVEKERKKNGMSRKDEDACDRNFLKMWQESNQHEPNEKGRTVSGMIRFFIPADRARYIDVYGNPKVEKSLDEIMQERKDVEGNPRKLANLKRKEPLTEKEAFQADGDNAIFNPEALNNKEDELKWTKPQYETGNFQWKDGKPDTEVEWVPSPAGRFKIAYHPPEGYKNAVLTYGKRKVPNNKAMFCAGIDTYDHRRTSSAASKLSSGSIVIIKKYHPLFETRFDKGPALLYLARPLPEIFYEDCIMAMHYYGCQALIETNKPGCMHHFEDRGYEEFAAKLGDKQHRGVNNSGCNNKVNAYIAEITDQFINDDIDTVVFAELVNDWQGFSPDDTTDYDAAMAFGYAKILEKNAFSRATADTTPSRIEDYLSWY